MTGIDWQGIDNAYDDLTPPPPGQYTLVCQSANATESSNGRPMIVATYAIIGGPEQGKTVTHFAVVGDTPFMRSRFGNWVKAQLGDLRPGTFSDLADAIVGKKLSGVIEHDTYNDELRAAFKSFLPAEGGVTAMPSPNGPPPSAAPAAAVPSGKLTPPAPPPPVVGPEDLFNTDDPF